MTNRDIEILNAILNYIGSNTNIQDEIAKYADHRLTEDEFDSWLANVEVK